MSLATLRTAIKTKLDTLTGAGQPLYEVLDYHTIDNAGYPYVTFEPSVLESSYLDTANNARIYTFDLFLFQEITRNGRQEALNILINSYEDIINAFDTDYTLGGVADGGIEAVGGEFGQIVSDDGKTLFANIKIKCKIIVDIT